MFIIGITGGIGTGKSSLAACFAKEGIPVLDADRMAHELTGQAGKALPALVARFGEAILNAEGSLDRAFLAATLFRDKQALDAFASEVHKAVFAEMDQALKRLKKSGTRVAVLDVPIPVKEGFLDRSDLVINVHAPKELRLKRLAFRGMHRDEALRRMDVQLRPEEYAGLAQIQVDNAGSLESLCAQALAIMEAELDSRGLPYGAL